MIKKQDLYNKDKVISSISTFSSLINYYNSMKEDLNYKDSNYLDIFKELLGSIQISNEEIIQFMKILNSNKDYELLNTAQEIKMLEISLLEYPNSTLNNNLKIDKKILINYEVLENLGLNFSEKNLFSLIKKIFPKVDKVFYEKFLNEKIIKNNLLDLNYLQGLLILSNILVDSDKISEIIFHEKSSLLKERDFLLDLVNFHFLINEVSLSKKKEILISLMNSPYPKINIKDVLNEYELIKNKTKVNLRNIKIKSFHCIHAYISHLYRKIQENGENIVYPYNKMFNNSDKLDNIQVDERFKLVLPKDMFNLITWGEVLNNCIASYNEKLLNLDCLLIGLQNNNKLVGALEYIPDENRIVQFVGHNNEHVNSMLFDKVQLLLTEFKRTHFLNKLRFKYKKKFELKYPEINNEVLKKFGFLRKESFSSFFNELFLEQGVCDKTSGLYLIEDPQGYFQKLEHSLLSKDELKDIILNNEISLIDYSKVYSLSKELNFKRDLSLQDLTELSLFSKKENKKLFIFMKNIKNKNNYKLFCELIIKIYKIHITDEFFSVESFPSINQKELLVFNIGNPPLF